MFKFLLLFFCLITTAYTQNKQLEYEALEVDGEFVEKEITPVETIEAPEEKKDLKQTEVASELEELEDLNEIKEIQEVQKEVPAAVLIPEKKEVVQEQVEVKEVVEDEISEVIPVAKEEKFYDFFFDNKKKSLFKTSARWKSFSIGLGGLSYFPGRYQTNTTGEKDSKDIRLSFDLSAEFGDIKSFSFSPHFFISLPEKSKDGFLTEYSYAFGLDAIYNLTKNINFRLGSSFLFTSMKGENSGIANLPSEQGENFISSSIRTAINNTLDFGVEFKLNKFSLLAKTITLSAFKKEKREYIHGLFLRYRFDKNPEAISAAPQELNDFQEPSLELDSDTNENKKLQVMPKPEVPSVLETKIEEEKKAETLDKSEEVNEDDIN